MIQLIENQRCCQKCRYWVSDEHQSWGRCHRYPPQFWSEGESSGACHVGTDSNDWCGEFRPEERWVLPEGFVLVDPHEKKKEEDAKTNN